MKAKNIFKLAFLGTFLLFASCSEDDLDLKYELGDIYDTSTGDIETESKLLYVTNGIYTSLGSSSFYGAQVLIFNEVVSENVFVSNAESGYNINYQNLNWAADSDLGFFNAGYDAIMKANIVINESSLPETEVVKSLKAEAKILRGFTYFTLAQLYTANPTSGKYQDYGLPLNVSTYNPNQKLSRATVAETYDLIIQDLTEGIANMGTTVRTGSDKTFISPKAGKLILAKVYLTRGAAGDYEKAIALADEVLAGQPTLASADMVDYFYSTTNSKTENRPETAFEIEQTSNYTLGVNAHPSAFFSNTGAHRSLLARADFYDAIKATSDKRKDLFSNSGQLAADTPKGIWIRKWVRNTVDQGNYSLNVKVLRYTEAKYVKMEAMAKLGNTAGALALLNEHAAERGAAPYSGDALTAILQDKQKEFIGEGYRFFDLKRNNLGFDRGTNCLTCSIDANSRYWILPIPLSELNRNPSMTQHPVWQ